MAENITILEFEGEFTFKKLNELLLELKTTKEFRSLKKSRAKVIYSAFNECIENIQRHSARQSVKTRDKVIYPKVVLEKHKENYIITSLNIVSERSVRELSHRIEGLNKSQPDDLKTIYDKIIKSKANPRKEGAGLGLIIMAIRSNSELVYSFLPIGNNLSVFRLKLIY